MPRSPPAPGRFSTITCEPIDSVSRCAMKRAMKSEPPPGAKGTRIWIGFAGYLGCAPAVVAASARTAAAHILPNVCMVLLRGLVAESRALNPYQVRNYSLSLRLNNYVL